MQLYAVPVSQYYFESLFVVVAGPCGCLDRFAHLKTEFCTNGFWEKPIFFYSNGLFFPLLQ